MTVANVNQLSRTVDVLTRQMNAGLHIGAQLYVSLRGQVFADVGIGEARRALR